MPAETHDTVEMPSEFLGSSVADREELIDALSVQLAQPRFDIRALIEELQGHEDAVLAWIDDSPGNRQQFVESPIAALKAAAIGLDAAALQKVQGLSDALAASAPERLEAPVTPSRAVSATPAAGAPELKTKGWDLIAAITQAALNDALKEAFDQGMIPHTIEAHINAGPPLGEGTVSVAVEAPTINLTPSQPGVVSFTLPIASGTLKFGSEISIPRGRLEVLTSLSYSGRRPGTRAITCNRCSQTDTTWGKIAQRAPRAASSSGQGSTNSIRLPATSRMKQKRLTGAPSPISRTSCPPRASCSDRSPSRSFDSNATWLRISRAAGTSRSRNLNSSTPTCRGCVISTTSASVERERNWRKGV